MSRGVEGEDLGDEGREEDTDRRPVVATVVARAERALWNLSAAGGRDEVEAEEGVDGGENQ